MRSASSTKPSPAPPSASGTDTPSQPSSASSAQRSSSRLSQSRSSAYRSPSQARAWRFSSACSAVSVKSISGRRSSASRQPEHALGDDVAEDLGGSGLDRVAAAAQLLVVPPAVVEDALGAAQLPAELRQPLVRLGP